jgi:MauM/NapG family ferredoxin protein
MTSHSSAAQPRLVNTKESTRRYRVWIRVRKAVQIAALIIFLFFMVATRSGFPRPALANLPMRLDPFLAISNLLSARVLLPGLALALSVLVLTVVFGRAWCGWLCPLGTVFDLFPKREITRRNPGPQVPESWRKIKYILLIATLALACLGALGLFAPGSLALLTLDPLTILYRSLTASIWPSLDWAITSLEAAAYQLPFLSGPITILDAWLRPGVFPLDPMIYRLGWLYAALLAGLILLDQIVPRFWCRYLCPLGGLLGWISRVALFQRQVSPDCKDCGLCSISCPTGTIDADRDYASDPAECTMCLDCLPSCPRSTIQIQGNLWGARRSKNSPETESWGPLVTRRQFLATLGLSAAAMVVARAPVAPKTRPPFRLRPPGALEDELMSRCLRCGVCMRACPTNALQPALTEAGVEGLWTPVLVPRLGYCDYACNACGQVCPVQAIPPLSLDEKRTQVIGKAYIDQNHCIAWSDHIDCIVCEEMCPLPDKAIYLEEASFATVDGDTVQVKVPHVERDRCIGCGICENRCPVTGQAAIRVYGYE